MQHESFMDTPSEPPMSMTKKQLTKLLGSERKITVVHVDTPLLLWWHQVHHMSFLRQDLSLLPSKNTAKLVIASSRM
jgi:hypothetical protein